MLIPGIIFAVLALFIIIGSYFAAYHAIYFTVPDDRTRPVLLIYLVFIIACFVAELIIFLKVDWNTLFGS